MITMLRVGMRVRLPSGNLIVLVRREGTAWVCQYVTGSQRGEVDFSVVYLRKYGSA